jgi:hypothetical protein
MEIWTGAAETAAADTTITGFSTKVIFWPTGGVSIGPTDPGAGALYVDANVSALSFTDRTPAYTGDALTEIAKISHNHRGEIDHSTLPRFIQSEKRDKDGKKVVERDLGGSISMLFTAVQQLTKENEDLKARIKALEG